MLLNSPISWILGLLLWLVSREVVRMHLLARFAIRGA
jgi:uncharacterized membrane protein YagU involved in acid resistance